MTALYHLNDTLQSTAGKQDLGPLPTTSVVLLSVIGAAWVLILLYVVWQQFAKKAKEGIDFPDISAIIRVFVTVQQVCAFTALTVRKLGLEGKKSYRHSRFGMDFWRVTVRVLNSYECLSKNWFSHGTGNVLETKEKKDEKNYWRWF